MAEERNAAKNFYYKAVKFCKYLEHVCVSQRNAEAVLLNVLAVFTEAQLLPSLDEEYGFPDVPDLDPEPVWMPVNGTQVDEFDEYTYFFSPYEPDSQDRYYISGDLREIYMDLQKGIAIYELGEEEKAVREWKDSLLFHWGAHALNVMRVLWELAYGNPKEL